MLLFLLIACSKPPPPVHLASADDVTEESLNRLVAELRPLVEEAAGREFEQLPYARLGRAADLERVLEEEFETFMGAIYPNAPEWLQRDMARSARASAPAVIGKYGVHTGVLYLAPDAVARIVELDEQVDEGDYDAIARLVMAHEMAHALQQEEAALDEGLGRLRDKDHFDGLRGATEGHANLVEQRVSQRLGLDDVRTALDRSQGWTDEGPTSAMTVELWALYGQGREFLRWHEAQGGVEQAWRVVREPPAITGMLFRPETYAPVLAGYEPDPALSEGIAEMLGDGIWIGVPSHISEISLRAELFGKDAAEVEAVLAQVDGFVHEASRDDRRVRVQVLRFPTETWRDRFLALALADDAIPRDDLAPGARWQRTTSGVVAFEVNEIWLPHGNEVVVIAAGGFRPGKRLDDAARVVLERLRARG